MSKQHWTIIWVALGVVLGTMSAVYGVPWGLIVGLPIVAVALFYRWKMRSLAPRQ